MNREFPSSLRKGPHSSSTTRSTRHSARSSDGSFFHDSDNSTSRPPSYPHHGAPTVFSQIPRLTAEFSHTECIGEGSFGAVLFATHDLDGQSYAVKKSQKPILGETDLQHRLQEAYAASVCSNPHLLRYYDSWVDDRALYIRSELVPKGSIHHRPRPWPEAELHPLLTQLCMALHWLHSANMAHLDVKPENILFHQLDNGEIIYKLGDFGLARRILQDDDSSSVSISEQHRFAGENDDEGDCRYLCPALLHSTDASTWREADVYSLGASVVDLMGGNPARVRQREYPASMRASLNLLGPDEPIPNVIYSPHFVSLIMRMTLEDPSQRPSAFDVLEELAADQGVASPNSTMVAEALAARRMTLQSLREELAMLESEIVAIESG